MEAVIDQLSAYKIERGKSIPDTIHAAVQMNIGIALAQLYNKQFRLLSELALATIPDGITPDIAIYPYFLLDYEHRTAKRSDAPLACIEIQSPSQSNKEMVAKNKIYFQFGVKSCWIVVSAVRGIFVYDQPDRYYFFHGSDTLHDPNLDIRLPLAAIFE